LNNNLGIIFEFLEQRRMKCSVLDAITRRKYHLCRPNTVRQFHMEIPKLRILTSARTELWSDRGTGAVETNSDRITA
jgi:hypothetical protein